MVLQRLRVKLAEGPRWHAMLHMPCCTCSRLTTAALDIPPDAPPQLSVLLEQICMTDMLISCRPNGVRLTGTHFELRAGHGSVRLQDPLTSRLAAVKDEADRLAALLLLAKGDYTAALPVLTALVAEQPNAHWAHADLGWCQFHSGQLAVRGTNATDMLDTGRMRVHALLSVCISLQCLH